MKHPSHHPHHLGFTIVELVIVIAVIGVLVTVLVPTFGDVIAEAQHSKAMQQAKNAYTQYIADHAAEVAPAAYYLYETDGRFVALENGAATGVYRNQAAALTAMLDDPDTDENEAVNYISVRMTDSHLHICRKDFSDLTYVAFGDSITYGIDGNYSSGPNRTMKKPYPTLVKELLNFGKIDKQGVSSATLCSLNSNSSLNMTDTILAYNGKADVISVLLGVNDYYPTRNFPLGQLGSNDKTTIYGSLNQIARHLTQNYPDALVFFMTPFPCRGGEQVNRANPPYNLPDVANAIKSVAAQYGIPVLDLYANGKYELEMNANTNDGIHPSQQHHIQYTAPLISEFIAKNYKESDHQQENTPIVSGMQTIQYSKQTLSQGYIKIVSGNVTPMGSSGPHHYFTIPASGIDTIAITPGGEGPDNDLCYVIHQAADGTVTPYAPIRNAEPTVIHLGGSATGTLYFNYYTDNSSYNSSYVKEATIVMADAD